MLTQQQLKATWLRMRIAYHRRQAGSYKLPLIRHWRREAYPIWVHAMALRHTMKAHALERELGLARQ